MADVFDDDGPDIMRRLGIRPEDNRVGLDLGTSSNTTIPALFV